MLNFKIILCVSWSSYVIPYSEDDKSGQKSLVTSPPYSHCKPLIFLHFYKEIYENNYH